MTSIPLPLLVASAGLLIGIAFGATAQRTNFCTMGAVADMAATGDTRRFRAWVLATAVAIAGSQTLAVAGIVDLKQSIYLAPRLSWFSAIAGGLIFGFGMTMTGGCASKNLIRLGGGSLRSLVVLLVLGVVAYMTLRGLLAVPRLSLEAATQIDLSRFGRTSQHLAELLVPSGSAGDGLHVAVAALAAFGLALWCFKDAGFRKRWRDIAAGLVTGVLVTAAWLATGWLGADPFEPAAVGSLSFVAPTADGLIYLMTFTGSTLNFGIALAAGVIVGGFAGSIAGGDFKVQGFAGTDDMVRHLIGAAMMGVGGIMAMGCSIGQGITGVSTLAASSVLAWGSIIIGAWYGIRYLEEGSLAGALRAVLSRS